MDEGAYWILGIQTGIANDGVYIDHGILEETRSLHPPCFFRQTKSGGSSLAKNTFVEDNFFYFPAGTMKLFDQTINTVWVDGFHPTFRQNTPFDHASSAPRLVYSGGIAPTLATFGNDTTPVTTETYLCEIFIAEPRRVLGIAMLLGTVTAGNSIYALANFEGKIVATCLSASIVGLAGGYDKRAINSPSNSGFRASPGVYYILAQFSSASARFRSHTFGLFDAGKLTGATFGTFVDFSPPGSFAANLGPVASLY
jgi:hypothetical protein